MASSPFTAERSESLCKWNLPPTPRNVEISITARCNLRCSFCYYADDMEKAPDLPTEVWLRFFEELEACKVIDLTILGGEPFARKDFDILVDSIVDHKMRFNILSNGTLIDQRWAEKLKQTSRVNYVQVSIDGDRETHDHLRGKGNFDRAVQGIENLKNAGVYVTVRFTITREGAYKVYDTCKFIYDMGIHHFGINEVFPRGRACDHRSELLLNIEDKLEGMRQMERFITEHPGSISDQGGGPLWRLKYKDAVEQYLKKGTPLPVKAGYLSSCRAAFSKIEVLHEGSYVPCNQLSGMVMGNIRTDSLEDLWQRSPIMAQLRERIDVPLSEVEGCKNCEYHEFCAGGCPAMVEGIEENILQNSRLECFSNMKEILDAFEFNVS